MTRTASFAALGVLTCGLVLGAPRPEPSTYVDGNVAALKPNTGGTLVFSEDKAILFRTGLAEVAVPYAGIRRAELGATQVHSHDAPAYKVWALPQRLHKTQTQLLTVDFRNDQGEDRSMTFELAKTAASAVLSTIQAHTVPSSSLAGLASSKDDKTVGSVWWGDEYWKTNRNQDTRNGQTSAAGSK